MSAATGVLVATRADCEAAVHALVTRLADVDPDLRTRYAVRRTVSGRIADLDGVFVGRLAEDGLTDVPTERAERAHEKHMRRPVVTPEAATPRDRSRCVAEQN